MQIPPTDAKPEANASSIVESTWKSHLDFEEKLNKDSVTNDVSVDVISTSRLDRSYGYSSSRVHEQIREANRSLEIYRDRKSKLHQKQSALKNEEDKLKQKQRRFEEEIGQFKVDAIELQQYSSQLHVDLRRQNQKGSSTSSIPRLCQVAEASQVTSKTTPQTKKAEKKPFSLEMQLALDDSSLMIKELERKIAIISDKNTSLIGIINEKIKQNEKLMSACEEKDVIIVELKRQIRLVEERCTKNKREGFENCMGEMLNAQLAAYVLRIQMLEDNLQQKCLAESTLLAKVIDLESELKKCRDDTTISRNNIAEISSALRNTAATDTTNSKEKDQEQTTTSIANHSNLFTLAKRNQLKSASRSAAKRTSNQINASADDDYTNENIISRQTCTSVHFEKYPIIITTTNQIPSLSPQIISPTEQTPIAITPFFEQHYPDTFSFERSTVIGNPNVNVASSDGNSAEIDLINQSLHLTSRYQKQSETTYKRIPFKQINAVQSNKSELQPSNTTIATTHSNCNSNSKSKSYVMTQISVGSTLKTKNATTKQDEPSILCSPFI